MLSKKRIRVLVADDSSFMRGAIMRMISEDPAIEVVGEARDGVETIEKVETLKPDVLTLDIEMPRMNGIDALRVIMNRHPLPVLMVSSLTEEGAEATFEALELGALDYVPKNLQDLSVNIINAGPLIVEKIKAIAGRKVERHLHLSPDEPLKRSDRSVAGSRSFSQRIAVVAIGASTGGPGAVQYILQSLPSDFPASILVVQHMPAQFTTIFAERMDAISRLRVREASDGCSLSPGEALIAPGGKQIRLKREKAIDVRVEIMNGTEDVIYKPSVDIALTSVAGSFPGRALGVILTGMGCDGREGVRAIKRTGGKAIAQDESSSVVYGMPKAIVEERLADRVLPLKDMPGEILNMV